MTNIRGCQHSIQSDGAGLRGRINLSKEERKGKLPRQTESTKGRALSQRKVKEMPLISEPVLELIQAVQHIVQGHVLVNFATNTPRIDALLAHPQKAPQTGGDSKILQWMESTIIQTSNQKDQGVPYQKEGGNQGKSPSSFKQQAPSQPTLPRREEEKGNELEKTTFPKLQDFKTKKRCHGKCLQHGQNLDGIQGHGGANNETTSFPKEIALSQNFLSTLKRLKNSILPVKEIKNSLLSVQPRTNDLSSLTKIDVQNKKEIDKSFCNQL
ncbi:hypothetical protein O181_111743 [Austropuccinia psidii MF-1]|uniref:Uncharacterized protein n=1 Tax=Austropuccinia psidii MF-1 TaxID=1389203 RepID=A0A9Q3PS06_9BASI|nr:hypothetical protein [Austropuccinia psidii MF-1]